MLNQSKSGFSLEPEKFGFLIRIKNYEYPIGANHTEASDKTRAPQQQHMCKLFTRNHRGGLFRLKKRAVAS